MKQWPAWRQCPLEGLRRLIASCRTSMADHQNLDNSRAPELCDRFAAIYTGAISDVLDDMGYRDQALPSEIQGLTIDQQVAGFALPVAGETTQSRDPEEIF